MTKVRVILLWASAIGFAGILPGIASSSLRAQTSANQTAAKSASVSAPSIQTLLDQAVSEEARGRLDLAVQRWQQVLLSEPTNAIALRELALATRRMGDPKMADSYERRLAAKEATPSKTPAPAKTIALTAEQVAQITQAAKLADGGEYVAAMAIYRKVFGTQPPADEAVAYYETEAATEGGRPDAISGLRAMAARYPADASYQVSLGGVLIYDPATREEGRRLLVKYPANSEATKAIRQSYIWDAANPVIAPQIRAYLTTHPDPQLTAIFQATQPATNAAVAPTATAGVATVAHTASAPVQVATARTSTGTRSSAVESPATTHTAIAPAMGESIAVAAAEVAAYRALNANHLDDAEARFKVILRLDPNDEKALAGIGYVRMQQGNFVGAISFLEQAKRLDTEDKGLSAALDTARFWFVMGEGHTALATNDLTTAERRYKEALTLRGNNVEALVGLGSTLLKAQEPGPAVPLFERATDLQSASADGWRGLFMAEFRNDEASLALATLKRIPVAPRTRLLSDPLFLQPLASAYAAVGQQGEAVATLESALKLPFAADQKGLKGDIQLDLADMLVSSNHVEQASRLFEQVVAADPANEAAWRGLVRLQHAAGHDAEALATIQKMPPTIYSSAIRSVGFAMIVASVYESLNKLDLAQEMLQKAVTAETSAGEKPSSAIEMQLADIYAKRGRPQLAYPVYQQVLRENPDLADAWEGLLAALHSTGHDKEAVEQVALIPVAPRAELQRNPTYMQTMAAVYAAVGKPAEATKLQGRVEQADATQRSTPTADLEIQKAWQLYNNIDDDGLYRQLMTLGSRTNLNADQRRKVQTIWTNWAARRAEQASAVDNPRRALEILNAAARAFPDNPAVIKLLAVGYVQAGEPHQAVLIYKAQNMASASAADYEAAVGAALSDGDNKDAEIWLRYALAAYPSDPQVLILAARFEQSRGDTARAIKYYRSSLKAMPPASAGQKLPSELGLSAPMTSLSLPSAERPQDLSVLLSPGYVGEHPTVQPDLPSFNKPTGQSPYGGTSQLVPPYMSNPTGTSESQGPAQTAQATVSPEVETTVQDASLRAIEESPQPSRSRSARVSVDKQSNVPEGEAYKPYVAFVAPPPPVPSPGSVGYRGNSTSAVRVQLGNDIPHPVRAQTDMTDVLPTERYGPSARVNQEIASRADVAAARADRIRRMREESAERSGQSHPPPEEAITDIMQDAGSTTHAKVRPPAAPPTQQLGEIPDTGAQQYPQPSTPPASAETKITRVRPVRRIPARHAPARAHTAVKEILPAISRPAPTPPPVTIAAVPAPAPVPAATAPAIASPVRTLTEGNAPVGPAYPLANPPTDAELRAHNLPSLGGAYTAQVPIPQTQRQQAENELASLESSYSGWLGVTGMARFRSGASGLDRLYDFEVPTEASAVVGQWLRLTAVAESVFLNSGALHSSSFGSINVPYLGTMAANSLNPPAQQYSNGIGGELQLAGRNIGLAVGYTPYEFPVRNITGRLIVSALSNHLAVYGERQPVKDTQLSYAGLHDPGTTTPFSLGAIWGGVISTSGGLRVQARSANANFFVSGEGGILTGQHVLDNYRFKATAGAMFRVKSWADVGSLKVGVTASGLHYQNDEVGLSYGQGGYFSPDFDVVASVPIQFEGGSRTKFHYILAGSVGAQSFREDTASFYPLDPGLESSLIAAQGAACTAPLAATFACGEYPKFDRTLFSYTFNSEASYRMGNHWYGGGFVSANNTSNFNNVAAGFFLRYVFRAQRSTRGFPAGLFTVDGVRGLQIP